MANTTSIINVQVETSDKTQATEILKDLGLNMSTYVNMAIKQLIRRETIPFRVSRKAPSEELKLALQELAAIEKSPHKTTGYKSVGEMMDAIYDEG